MEYIYFVIEVTGAHEPDAILSIWLTQEEAQRERDRLNAERPRRTYSADVAVAPIGVPADENQARWN